MCRYSGMYAGTSTPVISGCGFPQMPVPVGTLSAGGGWNPQCRWYRRYGKALPVGRYIHITRKLTQSERAPLGGGGHVTMTLTFDPKIYRRLPFFILHLCMKSVGQTLFELSRYNEVWRDGKTDGRTDRRRVVTVGLPHLRWRGPNNYKFGKSDKM